VRGRIQKWFWLILILNVCSTLFFSAQRATAFALLGPFESWMQTTNDLRQPGDIGGPMCISNAYRWNVPIVTYGFDPSFIDFFGTNGVKAVEDAIKILNGLPPASKLVLTNYPFDSQYPNFAAQAKSLFDLKSQTLSLLLEQLGLAQPTRSVYVLKQWTPTLISSNASDWWGNWAFRDFIVQRNFDPETLSPSAVVIISCIKLYFLVESMLERRITEITCFYLIRIHRTVAWVL